MKNFNLDAILEAMLKISDRVSDLNFSVGRAPQVEVDGQLVAVNFPGLPRLTPFQTETIAMHMLRGDRELTRTLRSALARGCLARRIPDRATLAEQAKALDEAKRAIDRQSNALDGSELSPASSSPPSRSRPRSSVASLSATKNSRRARSRPTPWKTR